jgi:hypothetical protein
MTIPGTLRAVLFAGAAVAGTWTGADVRIEPIVSEGRVLVSFTARDSWTLKTREYLSAGRQVSFEYTVELRKPAPLWFFDPVLARVRLTHLARLNNLTGRYQVTRMRDGRTIGVPEQLDQEAEVRDGLTSAGAIALDPVSPLELNAEYYVHVGVSTSPRPPVSIWSLLPFSGEENSGRKYFTYIR